MRFQRGLCLFSRLQCPYRLWDNHCVFYHQPGQGKDWSKNIEYSVKEGPSGGESYWNRADSPWFFLMSHFGTHPSRTCCNSREMPQSQSQVSQNGDTNYNTCLKITTRASVRCPKCPKMWHQKIYREIQLYTNKIRDQGPVVKNVTKYFVANFVAFLARMLRNWII